MALVLPPLVNTQDDPGLLSGERQQSRSQQLATLQSSAPPYPHRKGWVPRKQQDFGDGGAFPEVAVAQYPLGMGQKDTQSNALTVTLDTHGKINYDAIARQGQRKDKVVHSKYSDLLSKPMDSDDPSLQKPDEEELEETTEKTRSALEKLVQSKIAAAMPVRAADKVGPAQYIRYTPSQQGVAYNSGSKQRIIRMVEEQKDPMEPARFKVNKKIPRGPPSPPAPVMHSPNRKVSVKEQQEWKIPPCISNWKNAKGYTIPLDKRLAADGRGLQNVHISENFNKLAEALYIADRKAREAVEFRAQIEKKMAQKEKDKKEEGLRVLAQKAREERAGLRKVDESGVDLGGGVGVGDAKERDELRRDRQKERQRERNINRAAPDKRNRFQKERERDISEKIALGKPSQSNAAQDSLFDQRLFNQSQGMDSGYNDDEAYNVYDKAWRSEKELANAIYRPTKQKDSDLYGDDLDKYIEGSSKRFVPDREFAGTDRARKREGPVQYEKDTEDDPFGLNRFLTEVRGGGQKRAGETGDREEDKRKKRKDY